MTEPKENLQEVSFKASLLTTNVQSQTSDNETQEMSSMQKIEINLDTTDAKILAQEEESKSLSPTKNSASQRKGTVRMATVSQNREKNKITDKTYDEGPLVSRAWDVTSKGATRYAALEVGKTIIHGSISTIYSTCQLIVSRNKKRTLAKMVPGLALAFIPGVNIIAGMALSIGTSYLGEKVYDNFLSSRTVDVHHEIFLPNALLSQIDDDINLFKAKIMQMESPFYECRQEILDVIFKVEKTVDDKIVQALEELKVHVNDTTIKGITVDASAEKIIALIQKVQEWFNTLCNTLQELETFVEILMNEEAENLHQLQNSIDERFDNLVKVLTLDLPQALKNGVEYMDETLKKVKT